MQESQELEELLVVRRNTFRKLSTEGENTEAQGGTGLQHPDST